MKTQRSKKCNFDLNVIVSQIQRGKSPYEKEFLNKQGMSKQAMCYYVNKLKQKNEIRKICYGVWDVDKTQVKNNVWITNAAYGKHMKENSIRAHGFSVTLRIPKIKNWENREKTLKRLKINFTHQDTGLGVYQTFKFKNWTVRLYDKSIVFFAPKNFSIFSEIAKDVELTFVSYIISLFYELERKLKIPSLRVQKQYGKEYDWRLSRGHFALLKNALAKILNEKELKIQVYDSKGVLLLVNDSSFGGDELEIIRPEDWVLRITNLQRWFVDFENYPLTNKDIADFMIEQVKQFKQQNKDLNEIKKLLQDMSSTEIQKL